MNDTRPGFVSGHWLPNPDHPAWCIANSASLEFGEKHGCNCGKDSEAPGEVGRITRGGQADEAASPTGVKPAPKIGALKPTSGGDRERS